MQWSEVRGGKVAWNFPFIIILLLALIFASCGGDSVSSQDDSYSSALQSSTGESSSSTVDVDKSSSSELKLSSADESSSSVAISSTSMSSSNSESESSSSSMSRYISDCLMYAGEDICKRCESLSSSSLNVVYSEMIDERDGHIYKTITIDGKATWMAENLNYAYLQPTSTLDSSSWCYENESDSCAIYGRLYIWSAVMDSAGVFSDDTKGCGYYADEENWYECPVSSNVRGICPEHWHVPTSDEFSVPLLLAVRLVPCGPYSYGIGPNKYDYFGNTVTVPNDLLSVEWSNPFHQWSEEDKNKESFNLLPAGLYDSEYDWFEYNYSGASLWFSNEKNSSLANTFTLPQLIPEGTYDPRTVIEKKWAFPIRCVKDEVEE